MLLYQNTHLFLAVFLMVVLNKKITFGKNDWALLVCLLGIPAVPEAVFTALGWFGPSGFWYVLLKLNFRYKYLHCFRKLFLYSLGLVFHFKVNSWYKHSKMVS